MLVIVHATGHEITVDNFGVTCERSNTQNALTRSSWYFPEPHLFVYKSNLITHKPFFQIIRKSTKIMQTSLRAAKRLPPTLSQILKRNFHTTPTKMSLLFPR